jgi:hypothetical protein
MMVEAQKAMLWLPSLLIRLYFVKLEATIAARMQNPLKMKGIMI